MDHPDPSEDGRFAATGSRYPGWARLPEEPPYDPTPSALPDAAYRGDSSTRLLTLDPPNSSIGQREKRGPRLWQTGLAALFGAAFALVGFQLLTSNDAPVAAPTAAPAIATTPGGTQGATGDGFAAPDAEFPAPATNAVAIGETVIPTIVTVQVGSATQTDGSVIVQGSGSGVIIGSDGLIVTNDHVVDGGNQYQVVLSDGVTTYDARLIGTDALTDLAVLKINATDLPALEFGDTSQLRVGDRAVAVGSPLGLEGGPSLTVGVVSAFDRLVQVGATDTLYGMIQTDAPITQGSSGGALVDELGRLIGITTAVGVSEVGVEGIGFATPVELVKRVTDELIDTGDVRHAFIGITGFTSFAEAADGARVAAGVEIQGIEPVSGAFDAGLEPGDLIVAMNGVSITTMEDLIASLRYLGADDVIDVTVTTISGTSTLPLTLGLRQN